MKISIVTFYSLAKNASGAAEEAISIAKTLHAEGKLHRIVCYDYDNTTKLPKSLFYTPPCRFFYRATNKLFRSLERYGKIRSRRIRENLFDFFVSLNCKRLKSDVVLFLKPSFQKTVAKLKNSDVTTIAWASILHPEFNMHQVLKEEKRFHLKGMSTYTNLKRVQDLNRFFSSIDCLIVQSRLALSIYNKYGLSDEKTLYLPDAFGVNCNKYICKTKKQINPTFKVLHISNMNLIKGLGYLLTAWKNLNLKNAELILGGSVDKSIACLYKKIQPPFTTMMGPVEDTVSLYQQADVFVSPSVSDLNPYTILEAMACGTPVISSDMCGAGELISHGVNGFVYPYDSVYALQELLAWCYEHREKVVEMGKNARDTSISFKREHFSRNLLVGIHTYLERQKTTV